ncbi:MAG TPA: hypothetical protein VFS05_08870 [Gemmatimonadaceae bacterium]|nr:hypothetical protein [Gemmatimonadaceae bacterium]
MSLQRGIPALAAMAAAAVVAVVAGACASSGAGRSATSFRDLVTAEYDKSVDSTFLRTAILPLVGPLEVYASSGYPGSELQAPPERANLVFQETGAGPHWERPYGRSLTLVLDDTARVAFPETQYRKWVRESRGPMTLRVTEWVWVEMPAATLHRVAAAKKVSGTLDRTQFTFRPDHLAAIRELAKRMGPPPAATSSTAADSTR